MSGYSSAIGSFVIGFSPIGGPGTSSGVPALPRNLTGSQVTRIPGEPYHVFGGDLELSSTGDILLVSGPVETNQRIMRRLFTNLGNYLWDLSYGAGLPSQVGLQANASAIASVVRGQMYQEGTVAQTPQPTVAVTVNTLGLVICNINYTYAPTLQAVALSLPIVSGPEAYQLLTGLGVGITTGTGQPITTG